MGSHSFGLFLLFIASTRTSLIPGITVAGPTPEATLYTPALDAEYLAAGRPLTLEVIPMTPDGIPTPALISRAVLSLLKLPLIIVDAGSYASPRVPHIALRSRAVGGNVAEERALPEGRGEELFREARLLGNMLGGADVIVGESMPGGTTTAMAIMEALGYRAMGRMSSSSPRNPAELKERAVRRALERLAARDALSAAEQVGDPLHISIAGFVAGALEKGSRVLLAGGTQMGAVLAILRGLGEDLSRIAVATTRWVVEDPSADMKGLMREVAPEVPLLYSRVSFKGLPPGLEAYERGYAKEGVGAGGSLVLAEMRSVPEEQVRRAIAEEYERLRRVA
ncbi:MAG: TIGR00303 family protein [Acidilobaceae archaeon]|nr:TIGR00303 family protein [Acidilobaceae archaeon]MCX8165839.1 TIGR00303 family protein [Acidilobaceae archaeon]MDW7974847.1 TIGR00303 family protein [Sulfolobales archaeon]